MFKKIFMWIVLLIWLSFIFGSYYIIDTGERGLVFNLGKIQEKVYTPGVHFKIPFIQSIEKYSILPIVTEHNIEVNSNGAITKDNQTIGAIVKAYYKYDEDGLLEMRKIYWEYKLEKIIDQMVYESFKEIVGKYDIHSIAMDREVIRNKTEELIEKKIEKYPVSLVDIMITNYDWNEEFDKQISLTMVATQEVKKKEQELLIAEQEAQKQVKIAEATKQSLVLKAEGEKEAASLRAEAKALEGEGIRKYNEELKRTQQLEIELRKLEIERMKVEKRDGKYVPNNMYWPIPVDTQGGIKGK